MGSRFAALVVVALVGCARPPAGAGAPAHASPQVTASPAPAPVVAASCGAGKRMMLHFYDVGDGLAALVDLPDGRHILVDTGDSPLRRGCEMCSVHDEHLLRRMNIDLKKPAIDLLWVTQQRSDDLGGAPEVLAAFKVGTYVDNGRDADKPEVRRAHRVAVEQGVTVRVVDPEHRAVPIAGSAELKLRAVLPAAWPLACDRDPNECSIGMRIDYCASSVLFMGDTEHEEETALDPGGPVGVLQVAHHGSESATTLDFLAQVKPRYAVISAGRSGEGPNRYSCHPSARVVERLNAALGGVASKELSAFRGDRCDRATEADWASVPASDRLWATERDGDIVLSTTGDGEFALGRE
jgi:competence protein ComEC